MTTATIPSRTDWEDELHAMRERIDSFPKSEHPTIRGLLSKYEAHLYIGMEHGFMSPREAARA